ncbi:MAG: uridylate kinase [Candidatus Improbicoccus devescovinae]|nr:MAG: uridylate kinase [Candidatus Improbicoccus devescovinae]
MLNYERIILKLSGESLADNTKKKIISFDFLDKICKEIGKCVNLGAQIGIVIGGGNIWRGRDTVNDINRVISDQIGVLATVQNALILGEYLQKNNIKYIISSAIQISNIAGKKNIKKILKSLSKHKVVIFAAGTGNPFFSTDTAAAIRAAEINADIILKATNVNGVYAEDPKLNADSALYDKISFNEILKKNIKILDSSAIILCREHNIPICVFNIQELKNIRNILEGSSIGTYICN